MLMDGNSTGLKDYDSADELMKSTFRVKHVMATSLLFDTYNYLTLLQDPVLGVADGLAGRGLQSDIDFELLRYPAARDAIYLKGKKYSNTLKLYKASVKEKDVYLNSKYSQSIDNSNAFFTPKGTNYFEYNGKQIQISISPFTKFVQFLTLDCKTDTVVYSKEKFGFTASGLDFLSPIKFENNDFKFIKLEDTKYYIFDLAGEKYEIKFSPNYIIPLKYIIGTVESEMLVPGPKDFSSKLPLVGWSNNFITHWNSFNTKSMNGYSLTIGNTFYSFDKVSNRIASQGTVYQGGSGFATSYAYIYEFNSNGEIKFKSVGNANAAFIIGYMDYLTRMLNDTFVLSYDVDPDFGKVVKFTSKEVPTYSFSWVIN